MASSTVRPISQRDLTIESSSTRLARSEQRYGKQQACYQFVPHNNYLSAGCDLLWRHFTLQPALFAKYFANDPSRQIVGQCLNAGSKYVRVSYKSE
jgi:hypothetical protein